MGKEYDLFDPCEELSFTFYTRPSMWIFEGGKILTF